MTKHLPPYAELAARLRERIEKESLPPGSWIGTEVAIASESGLSIIRRQAGEERQEGDVYELPIECKEWEGSLESLVKFLYAVHAEGAMLDVRKLFIRPGSSAAGKAATGLRGSFTLFCAYLRSDSNPNPERDNR